MSAHGKLVIISSPSGGGKNSVINALLRDFSGSTRLVTTTTRSMRPGEADGVDYYFIARNEFERKLAAGDFLEHNVYAGHYYGTDRHRLEAQLMAHPLVFSQIEVNGKHQLSRAGVRHLAIFLLPENFDVLRARILARGGLRPEVIERRLAIAREEIMASIDYNHRIVNREGHLDETVATIRDLLRQPAAY
ncbi:MAG: guanylate kinase [Candidatus Magasanikbacteria bacterium]|nr:guanylate kinase [Candidatus Magasanikbacteria bacterium]